MATEELFPLIVYPYSFRILLLLLLSYDMVFEASQCQIFFQKSSDEFRIKI